MMRVLCFCVCTLLLIVGCDRGGPVKHKVHGVVELDKQAIAEAELTFLPDDKNLPPEGARVHDGKYEQMIAAGTYKVKIHAPKKVPLEPGEAAGTPGEKEKIINLIPEHYADHPPTAEVKGPGEINFRLESKK
jgi:hypothetical protein